MTLSRVPYAVTRLLLARTATEPGVVGIVSRLSRNPRVIHRLCAIPVDTLAAGRVS